MRFGLPRPPMPLFRLGVIAPQLCDPRIGTPRPALELPLTELLRSADGITQILLRLVEAGELSLGDAALCPRVRQLPTRSELGEDRDPSVQPRKRLFEAAEVLEHAPFLH